MRSLHTSGAVRAASPTTCSTSAGEACGPKFVSRPIRYARFASPANARLRIAATRSACRASRAIDTESQVATVAPRFAAIAATRSEAAVFARTTPRMRPPNSSGCWWARASTLIPPMLCPITTAGPSATSASRTARRSRPSASSE